MKKLLKEFKEFAVSGDLIAIGVGLVMALALAAVIGALVENVSLGLAMCSERVALFTAVVEEVRPRVLAVCSERTGDALTFPCGACLQVGLEVAGPDLIIVAVDTDGVRGETSLQDLLPRGPHRFSPSGTKQ